ncbi:Bromodomain containing protein [Histomonas meleagridis]|uniref:Bromodomain containing protein n=1 Tax=Histomonas meleagridis TaxID=135588 RepID=UPI003559D9C8|nr:Bromodomain containing protein [Histomonas meleagridis]KAH0801012.1 Bromodomain containing protein [Histomonas meleagridis]
MNDFKKQKCIELTNKMLRMDLCRPFKDKVDPIRDGAPDYLTIVQRPMDLTTIRKKLNNNEYKSYENWAEDVNQVWENAMIYNNEGTLIYVMAQDMELWFRKKYQNLPQDRDEEWMKTLRKASKKMLELSRHPPSSIASARASIFTDADFLSTISLISAPKSPKKRPKDDTE